jgi:hypothetical protein
MKHTVLTGKRTSGETSPTGKAFTRKTIRYARPRVYVAVQSQSESHIFSSNVDHQYDGM